MYTAQLMAQFGITPKICSLAELCMCSNTRAKDTCDDYIMNN